jgi:hypothetical protein
LNKKPRVKGKNQATGKEPIGLNPPNLLDKNGINPILFILLF